MNELNFLKSTYFGDADTFGKHSNLPLKTSSRLLKMEKDNDEAMIVFLADIWLDDSKVSVIMDILIYFIFNIFISLIVHQF